MSGYQKGIGKNIAMCQWYNLISESLRESIVFYKAIFFSLKAFFLYSRFLFNFLHLSFTVTMALYCCIWIFWARWWKKQWVFRWKAAWQEHWWMFSEVGSWSPRLTEPLFPFQTTSVIDGYFRFICILVKYSVANCVPFYNQSKQYIFSVMRGKKREKSYNSFLCCDLGGNVNSLIH